MAELAVHDKRAADEAFVPFFPLIRLDVPVYEPQALPLELAELPPEKPGSRKAPVPSAVEGA